MPNKLVYIAEDDKFNGELLSTKLKSEGYDVKLAINGEEVIEFLKEKRPDFLLLDLLMPKKNGFDVLQFIKDDDKLSGLRVVVISNLMLPEDIARVKKLGALDYLIKSEASLHEIIEKILGFLR